MHSHRKSPPIFYAAHNMELKLKSLLAFIVPDHHCCHYFVFVRIEAESTVAKPLKITYFE